MTLAFSKVAIIGAGAMGRGIAQIAAQAGSQVWLFDTQAGASAKAREALGQTWDKLAEKGKLTPEAVAGYKACLQDAASLQDLAACELVVEAIVEKIEIKKTELSDAELEARIKEKLNKFAKIVDITDVTEVEEVECQSIDNEADTES